MSARSVDAPAAAPSGWFATRPSRDLPASGVEPLEVLGRDLVLYRDDAGAPHVLDAHCRHLGAHMGYGGRVEGSALRCPFHGWRWEPDGHCSDVPYSGHVPGDARITPWPVCEAYGFVYLWHDAAGAAPRFALPDIPLGSLHTATHWRWKLRAGPASLSETTQAHGPLGFLEATETELATERELARVRSRVRLPPSAPASALLTSWTVDSGAVEIHHLEGSFESLTVVNRTPIDAERTDVRVSHLAAKPDDDFVARLGEQLERDVARCELIARAVPRSERLARQP